MFKIEKKIEGKLGRAGIIETPHGEIRTPAFIPVGTKATVKALTPEMLDSLGAEAVLANAYHLYLQPGSELVARAGGFPKFMNWKGPSFTDSGGFQVFSLGQNFGNKAEKVNKMGKVGGEKNTESIAIAKDLADTSDTSNTTDMADTRRSSDDEMTVNSTQGINTSEKRMAFVDEEGVDFKSVIDGSAHRFTPESSMKIQHDLGADIIFAFDECASPLAPYEYQKSAMERTHRWAKRSLDEHIRLGNGSAGTKQMLFGIVQGGRFEDLRKESASVISKMDFDGFGIGGSFDKSDMGTAVAWVNAELPENKPRHLLGIGEPEDLIEAVENGCDTFDCVTPTRMGRNGTIFTRAGKKNILNAQYRENFGVIEKDCDCYTCKNYTFAYLHHLFKAKEMLAGTLASIHNLRFLINFVASMREAIIAGDFERFKKQNKFWTN